MTMNKKRMADMMQLADKALRDSGILKRDENGPFIEDSYNGQTSAFGITVLMSGLIPALAIYYQDASDTRKINRRNILEAIGKMIENDKEVSIEIEDQPLNQKVKGADTLLRTAFTCANDKKILKQLSTEVLECATALKQVIRTYKLKKSSC